MQWHRMLALGVFGVSSLALGGCSSERADNDGGGRGNIAETGPLRGATIPANFDFALTRPVGLTLSADKSLFGPKGVAGVEVKDARDHVLFRGPIRAGKPLAVGVVLPVQDDSVSITFRTPGVEQTSSVNVAKNTATHTFQ